MVRNPITAVATSMDAIGSCPDILPRRYKDWRVVPAGTDGTLPPVTVAPRVSSDDSNRRPGDSTPDGRPGEEPATRQPGEDSHGGRSGAGLLAVLPVRRNLAAGLAVGLAVAALAYAVRMLELFGPAPARGSPTLFFGLALVLATTVATLVAVVLSAVGAYRLARRRPK